MDSYHIWRDQVLRTALDVELRRFKGNIAQVARLIGASRPNTYRLLRRLGLEANSYRNQSWVKKNQGSGFKINKSY